MTYESHTWRYEGPVRQMTALRLDAKIKDSTPTKKDLELQLVEIRKRNLGSKKDKRQRGHFEGN
jgi:hypothetical protein